MFEVIYDAHFVGWNRLYHYEKINLKAHVNNMCVLRLVAHVHK